MCFRDTGHYKFLTQCRLAAECRVFGDNSALEFCGVLQNVLRNLAKFAVEKRWPW